MTDASHLALSESSVILGTRFTLIDLEWNSSAKMRGCDPHLNVLGLDLDPGLMLGNGR